MSKQRDMLPEVLAYVQEHVPDCPVYVGGSVSLGNERPDSDIDVVVIVRDVSLIEFPGGVTEWNEGNFRLVAVPYKDVMLQLHIATSALLRGFEAKPWRAYKFLSIEELYDPERIVQQSKDRIAPWFKSHPDAVQLWRQWLNEHKERQLSRGKQIGPLLQQFPNQMPDFWNHLDEMYGDKVAEPANSGYRPPAAGSA